METDKLVRIGQLATKAGVTPRTIRFYVEKGLIPKPVQTRKNMALYHLDCVSKIQAIKKAQASRFMPLVVIRQILEENHYDYDALEAAGQAMDTEPDTSGTMAEEEKRLQLMPRATLAILEKRKWVECTTPKKDKKQYSLASNRLIRLFEILNQHGAEWEDLLNALDSMESLVRQTVELEVRSFTGWALKNQASNYNDIQTLAENALNSFMVETRRRHLAQILCQHKKDLDYSFLASADEGFALPPEEITTEIHAMEKKLKPRKPDIRQLNDLAIGYSCMGDIETALRYLRRIMRIAPDNLETRVRWIWYRRFFTGHKGAVRLKQQMKTLVEENPKYAVGRTFLGIWYIFDILETDDPHEIFRLANRCLHEFAKAEENIPKDIHQKTLIQYAKSRMLMDLPGGADHLSNSILSFEAILSQKSELDAYYSAHLPFFPKWLWPNVYYFSGLAYQRAGLDEKAINMFTKGGRFNVLPPYHDHIEAGILKSGSVIQE
ncbi:MAG: MerR family transcriptional regulator [Desulfobacteraceae bacterium]|nr:MerR family transcriptional regulator [Desulfobacteraceae bacterium]